jgi:hypothetical protein
MQANYISYFGKNNGLGQPRLPRLIELAEEASNPVVNVKKAAHAKIRREKARISVAESGLFSQYSLDL